MDLSHAEAWSLKHTQDGAGEGTTEDPALKQSSGLHPTARTNYKTASRRKMIENRNHGAEQKDTTTSQ